MGALDFTAAVPGTASRSGSFPVRRLGDRLAVVSAGARFDEPTARSYAQAVLRATHDGVSEVVLDLSAVRQHAWPAIYALCELEAHLVEACCDLVAVAAEDLLARDLQAVGLQRVWTLRPSVPEALSELLARPV